MKYNITMVDKFNGKKLAKRIRLLRKKHYDTQLEFSELLGCSGSHVSDIETGKCLPDARELFQICCLCETDFYDLYKDSVDMVTLMKQQNWSPLNDDVETAIRRLLTITENLGEQEADIKARMEELIERMKSVEKKLQIEEPIETLPTEQDRA